MLAAALRSFGANVTTLCRAPDDLHATIEALESIDVDLLITVGGVSQGTRDHVKPAWDALGATPLVDRVPIQPGKPTRCWKTPSGTALALPGNPVAAIICAHLFARPWVRASLGLLPLDDWSNIALDHDVTPNPTRTLYRAVNVNSNARLATWHGSGDLPHLAGTDGIVECAMQRDVIPAGTVCPFLRWTLD
jgi:molybdopterin molybdotransferase